MIKVRDGYGKLIGSNYNGNIAHVLLSNGGNLEYAVGSTASTLVQRNASGQIESSVASTVAPFVISSTKVNTNLNADLLDGFQATGLFQSLTSAADKNLYIKIGDTEKEVSLLYASYLGGVTKEGLFTELTNVNDSTNPNSIKVTIGDTTKYLKVAYSDLAGKVVCSSSTNDVDRPIVVTNTSNGVYYSTKVTLNYSTGNVTAPTFTGTLIGNADTATTASKLSTVSKTAWGQTYWTSDGVPTSISGDMTGVGNITIASGGNVDRFITFDTASTRSWRIGYLGSGSGDVNYLAFQSTKTLTAADGWHDMLKIGCETGNAILAGQLTAKNFVSGDGVNDFSAGTVKLDVLNIPTSAGGTTFGPGAAGQVLKSNGTTVYWGDGGSSGGGYWANLPTQSATDTTTIPTFGGVIVNGTSILNGQVGIGILNPKAKLTVNVGALSANPTSGLLGTLNTMSVGAAGSYGTYFWTRGSGKGYIQVGREDGTATTYDLILQLLGGNVGIGTENPAQKLDVAGKVKADALYLTRTNGDVAFTIANEASTNGFNISATGGSSFIRFYTNNGGSSSEERMRIHTNGFVGIGTPSPNMPLTVNGATWINSGGYINNRATLILNSNDTTNNAADIIFKKNNTTTGTYGHWAISARYDSTYRFSIFRGAENGSIASEAELFTLRPDGDVDIKGTINLWNTTCTQNHDEGIRLHASSAGWNALVFCGTDNTGDVGTSAKTWGIYTNIASNFFINKNSSSGLTASVLCNVGNNWGIGTISPTYKLHVAGSVWGDNLYSNDVTLYTRGSGTYTRAWICAKDSAGDFIIEAPLTTDSSSGTRAPITLTWRGGFPNKGGLKITGESTAQLGSYTILHTGNASVFHRSDFDFTDGTTVANWVKATSATRSAGNWFSVNGWTWASSKNINVGGNLLDRMQYSALSIRNGNLTSTWAQQAILFIPTYADSGVMYLAQMTTSDTAGSVTTTVKYYGDVGYNDGRYVNVTGDTMTNTLTIGAKVSSRKATWLKLKTPGHTGSDAWCIMVDDTTDYSIIQFGYTASAPIFHFRTDGALIATHFYESSDAILKTNIQDIIKADKIPTIRQFDWKSDGSRSYGLIAQELEEMGYSELVDNSGDHKTVKYSAALSLIVGKLQVKIKELEKEIEILKNKN